MNELCRRQWLGMSQRPQGSERDWQLKNMPSMWKGLAYASSLGTGTGLWIVVGDYNYIATSSDTGVTWVSRNSGFADSQQWNSVAWTGSQFIVVGGDGAIITSSDGVTWTAQTSGGTDFLISVAYGGTKYIACASSTIYTSSNGTSWSSQNLPGGADVMYNVDYTNSKFFLSGRNDVIETTDGGTTWTFDSVGLTSPKVAYSSSQGIHVMMGNSGLTSAVNCHFYTSTDGYSWTIRTTNAINGSVIIKAVKWDSVNSIFIAVGTGGTIITSTNGTTWTAQTSGTSAQLNCIGISDSGIFVAGTADVLTSTTGSSWTAKTHPGTNILGATFNTTNKFYALVGSGGAIYTTGDLTSYTTQTSGTSSDLNAVVHNGTVYCAVGLGGIFTSTNESSWTLVDSTYDYYDLIYASSRWYAVGVNILHTSTSASAATWSTTTQPDGVAENHTGVCHNGTVFVVVGSDSQVVTAATTTWTFRFGCHYNHNMVYVSSLSKYVAGNSFGMFYSTDAKTWTNALPAATSAGGRPRFCWSGSAVIATIDSYLLFTSTNATSYTQQTAPGYIGMSVASSSDVLAIGLDQNVIAKGNSAGTTWTKQICGDRKKLIFANSKYVVGSSANGVMSYSTDRSTWTVVSTTASSIGAIAGIVWDGTNYVAVTSDSQVLYSTTGASWTVASLPAPAIAIAWNGTMYVMITESGNSYTSTNKTTWTNATYTNGNPEKVIWSSTHSLFIAVGASGLVATSPDALTWTTRTSNTTYKLLDVVWCPELSLFVAGGFGRTIITSPDATTAWTVRTPSALPSGTINSLAWSGKRLLAGSTNYVYSSPDAINWEYQSNIPSNMRREEIIWDGTRFVGITGLVYGPVSESSPH